MVYRSRYLNKKRSHSTNKPVQILKVFLVWGYYKFADEGTDIWEAPTSAIVVAKNDQEALDLVFQRGDVDDFMTPRLLTEVRELNLDSSRLVLTSQNEFPEQERK